MSRFGVLLDIDGVLCNHNGLMPGAEGFINDLKENSTPFMCLTNNSLKRRSEMAAHLVSLGLSIREDQIYTSAMSAARFLASQKKSCRVYPLGHGGLITSLEKNGLKIVDDSPDFVIVGEGRDYTLDMLDKATVFLKTGARLVTVNMDNQRSTAFGLRRGCSSIVKLLEDETGQSALNLGKPSPLMLRGARKLLGLSAAFTVMIGDHMGTDIQGGLQLGYHTILCMTGRMGEEEMKRYPFLPDTVIEDLSHLSYEELQDIINLKVIDEDYLITYG